MLNYHCSHISEWKEYWNSYVAFSCGKPKHNLLKIMTLQSQFLPTPEPLADNLITCLHLYCTHHFLSYSKRFIYYITPVNKQGWGSIKLPRTVKNPLLLEMESLRLYQSYYSYGYCLLIQYFNSTLIDSFLWG